MRHPDEGELHAYLDAADNVADVAQHLTECAECRARLEDVRLVRDRAAGILAAAAPQVTAPPFERVLVARAGRSITVARRSWRRQLAAAAVVALVVGVGWYAARRVTRTNAPAVAIAGSERTAGEAQAAGAVSPSGVPESARAFSTRAGQGERGAVADQQVAMAERAGGTPAPEGAARAGVTPGQAAAAREADELRAAAKPAEEQGVAARWNVEEKRVAEGGAPGAAAAGAAPGAAATQRDVPPAPPAPPAQPAAAEPEFMPVRAPRAQQAVVRSVADSGWVPATEAHAAARLGGPVAVVEGLSVTGVAVREEAGAVVVRVTQQLGAGREVELIQRALPGERQRAGQQRADEETRLQAAPARAADQAERAAPGAAARGVAAPAAAPTPAEAQAIQERASAAVVWRGYEVTARGPVPAESLRVLLARLRAR